MSLAVAIPERLAMINLYIKFEICMFIYYEGMKGNAKCRTWDSLIEVVRG